VNPAFVVLIGYFLIELLLFGIGSTRLGSPLTESNRARFFLPAFALFGVALYTATRVTTARARTILLGCIALGLTLNAAIGVLQIAADVNLRFFLKAPGFVLLDARTANGGALDADMSERFGVQRAVGASGHAIEYSVLSAVAIILNLHFARFAENPRVRVAAAVGTLVAAGGVVVGVSRSGLVALSVALLFYVLTLNLRQLATGLFAAAATVGAAAFLLPGSATALLKTVTNSSEDDSVLVRIAAFAKVSDIFHQYPIFGLGPNSTSNMETGHFDNEWLQVLAQGGIVGTINMIALCLCAIFGIAAALRSATNLRERDQAFAMGAMMVGILSSTWTYDMFAYQQVTYIFFVLFALQWCTFRVTVPTRDATAPVI
jgi:O-antigen ligase